MSGQDCWGYGGDNGPLNWHKQFPFAQGERQSPIDIVPAQAVYDANLTPISISYSACTSLSICNNGYSVMVEFEDCNDKTVVSGGPLENPYKLKQFHFHWGQRGREGSEHTVDGKSYPGELHLVHWNSTKYKTFGEAAVSHDGLAVVAVFLETGDKHVNLHRLTDALYMVKFKETKAQFKDFDPQCLLPKCRDYWTYPGSLTTPPLYESVTWIVFREPIRVSEKQMDKFRMLLFSGEEDSEKQPMVDNFRPPQPLKGRTVLASFKL
ncbi:carbonic anhydrase 7 isoform X1 [Carcharodon carcharias]|uniref:carbonic anhydrase 7 isoform X1 n=1 Tax=Carcharodon carcharias TaxID=13397 RepID=UPI001B7D952D|nr:carbonic anhydrase 7 isoform X1 [Carcharodon carcharias]